ncbi:MAG: hypothetical protein K6F88_04390, partial [Ruminococcus sp.]|nr:hypothetical protein [Ruminococcus sp.]
HFNSSGSLTATFSNDSYVYINANGTDYKTASYVSGSSGSFYAGNTEKMFVPKGTATFTLTKSGSGFSLSYTTSGGGGTTDPTEPTNPTTDSALYLSVPSTYEAGTPNWYIWTWGTGSGRAVKGTKDSTSGYYKFTDSDSNVIFLRIANGSTFDGSNWSNPPVWNKTNDLTVPSGNNLYTINSWDNLAGTWSTYTPPATKYDYTVVYRYEDGDGVTKTITRAVSQSELTDANAIAALKDPSSTISNMSYKYALGSASKSGTTVTAYLTKTANTYTVKLNGVTVGSNYKYLDKATVTNPTETGFLIDGNLIKRGTYIEIYVTGDIDITTDSSATRTDSAAINLTATYIADDKVSYELLATANVDKFARMGVVFSASTKTTAQLKGAINQVTGSQTQVYNKIAVHNSSVDFPNSSGLYQFTYAPYFTNLPANGATLYFYTFAVTTEGSVVISDAKTVSVPNSVA